MRLILIGGGTGGSVAPLLAVASELQRQDGSVEFLFIGSANGPERKLVEAAGLSFQPIQAGKFRRYLSALNILDVFRIIRGFFQALRILRTYRPKVMIGAGSYVQVPVIWAGWLLGIPSVIHQQDVVPSLSNRLCASVAQAITVTFERSLSDFPRRRTHWVGNPIRLEVLQGDIRRARERFDLRSDLPVLFAFGGGTGALRLNQLVAEAGLDLVHRFQIIHLTGGRQEAFDLTHPNYHAYDFITEGMGDAYAVADIVVCRAGLSTLAEVAALGKAAVLLPLPNTHQVANAHLYAESRAAVVLDERQATSSELVSVLTRLIEHPSELERLRTNVRNLARPDATSHFIAVLRSLMLPPPQRHLLRDVTATGAVVRIAELLSRHTNFRIGGPADLFVVAQTRDQAVATIQRTRRRHVPLTVFGGGANVVVSDAGLRGLVLQLRNAECSVRGTTVVIGAGTNTGLCVSRCHAAGLTGVEFLVGIYGTIGGAVRGNAGSFGREMKDVVAACEVVMPSGSIVTLTNAQLKFGYRDSLLKHQPGIILRVHLSLEHGDVAAARAKIQEYTTYKRDHQPLAFPSAGCIFKNLVLGPEDRHLRDRFHEVVRDDRLPAWALIAEAGLAGYRIGDVQVSQQHANFFINRGQATAEQVIMLASYVKQQVRDQFGVQLQEEVQFIGFEGSAS